MPTVHVNGINLVYETHGSGDPLVLISGIGYDRWQWHKMVPGLAGHFTVITFDNRGVGQTDKPVRPYTAQMLADDTAGLIQALGYQCAHVMGHSMGGFVAQALALNHPAQINETHSRGHEFWRTASPSGHASSHGGVDQCERVIRPHASRTASSSAPRRVMPKRIQQ